MSVNVAVTDCAALMETVQVPVPEHAPDQPANELPAFGVAVKVTEVPAVNPAEQLLEQEIPAGELTTEPAPVPEMASVRVLEVDAR